MYVYIYIYVYIYLYVYKYIYIYINISELHIKPLYSSYYPLVISHSHGTWPIEIDDFPIKSRIFKGFSMAIVLPMIFIPWTQAVDSPSPPSRPSCDCTVAFSATPRSMALELSPRTTGRPPLFFEGRNGGGKKIYRYFMYDLYDINI